MRSARIVASLAGATRACAMALLMLSVPSAGAARDLRGYFEARSLFYPALELSEARVRLLARYDTTFDKSWVVVLSACADGVTGSGQRRMDGVVQAQENYLERRGARFEIRLGMSSVAWGVLDELSPQDVVSPIDVSRFVLEGRSEARLPVPLARVRFFLPASLTLEGLLVPYARRGVFDQLDEARSPFAPEGAAARPKSMSRLTSGAMEGGLRLRAAGLGIDWGMSVYRDVVDFDRYEFTSTGLLAQRPARWMAGGDIEAVRGGWVLRGDAAVFIDDPLQAEMLPAIVRRRTFQGGVGADRRVGNSTFFVNTLYSHVPEDRRVDTRDEISLFGGLTRDLAAGRATLRLFGLWNARSDSGFGRATWDRELVENLRLEFTAGVFLGQGGRLFGSLDDADLVSARIRFYF